MGATLSKLWGSLRATLSGGAAGKGHYNDSPTYNSHARDIDRNLPAPNTSTKPPTPMPDMGSVKKYEITEVSGLFVPRGARSGVASAPHKAFIESSSPQSREGT
jgi:hypothetical protein